MTGFLDGLTAETIKDFAILGAAAAFLTVVFAVVAYRTFRRFRAIGWAFVLISIGFGYAFGTKPSVTWDWGLADSTAVPSHFTNDYGRVVLAWTKTNSLPAATAVTISAKSKEAGAQWQSLYTTTAGALGYTFDLALASNYTYWVWHNYDPPSPVHTNGVWLGNVLALPNGATNATKMIIINGQLLENGRILAPPQSTTEGNE